MDGYTKDSLSERIRYLYLIEGLKITEVIAITSHIARPTIVNNGYAALRRELYAHVFLEKDYESFKGKLFISEEEFNKVADKFNSEGFNKSNFIYYLLIERQSKLFLTKRYNKKEPTIYKYVGLLEKELGVDFVYVKKTLYKKDYIISFIDWTKIADA